MNKKLRVKVDGRFFNLVINEWGTVTVKGLPGWWDSVARRSQSVVLPKTTVVHLALLTLATLPVNARAVRAS
jgi:hypothetical protein